MSVERSVGSRFSGNLIYIKPKMYRRGIFGETTMRLTTFTDYGLRLLMYLACAPEKHATIREVAQAYGISVNHLVKVAHLLGRNGVLLNTRGRKGGVSLARPPSEINIGSVVLLTEHGYGAIDCLDGACRTCRIAPACRLPGMLNDAMRAFYAELESYSLADLTQQPARLAGLLDLKTDRTR
jgi:Rrf2 family nitric oxide-sensitive transcriptional repressor